MNAKTATPGGEAGSAISAASQARHPDAVELLLQHGAHPNVGCELGLSDVRRYY
jgi:hypothetical protein